MIIYGKTECAVGVMVKRAMVQTAVKYKTAMDITR